MSQLRVAVVLFGPEGQGSFNESGAAGADAARARYSDLLIDIHWIAPRDPDGRTEALRAICRKGVDLLVAHGGQGDAPVSAVAPEFSSTAFAITQGGWVAHNCASYEVLQEHSAFLAGVLAGRASRSGVVAHLSGERVRPGLKGRAAFAHGVRASGTGCTLVTGFCGHQHDSDRSYALMTQIRSAGADMVFAMIDGGRPGVIRACREGGLLQIGNVLDWVSREPGVFAASAIADSGACIEEAIADFAEGRWKGGSHRVHGVAEPHFVRLAMREDMAQSHHNALSEWVEKLAAGNFAVEVDYDGPELRLL